MIRVWRRCRCSISQACSLQEAVAPSHILTIGNKSEISCHVALSGHTVQHSSVALACVPFASQTKRQEKWTKVYRSLLLLVGCHFCQRYARLQEMLLDETGIHMFLTSKFPSKAISKGIHTWCGSSNLLKTGILVVPLMASRTPSASEADTACMPLRDSSWVIQAPPGQQRSAAAAANSSHWKAGGGTGLQMQRMWSVVRD